MDADHLRRCLRDVFGLLTLPSLWSGADSESILETLLEAVESVVPVEFLYGATRPGPGGAAIERLRWQGAPQEPGAPQWQAALDGCGVAESTAATGTLTMDGTTLRFVRLPIGYYADYGVLIAAAGRDGFPAPEEHAFLRAAMTLASTGFNTARIMLEREAAIRLKDEFLAMLGHELRNPVAAIRSATTVLGRADALAPMRRQAQEVLDRQTAQLTRLLDDLLDVSRTTSGQITLDLQPVDLGEIVERAVAVGQASTASEHEITLTTRPVKVRGDAARIEQIVMNLLSNAIKYTPAPGRIRLEVYEEGAFGVLRVTDSGIGISPQLLPRIFDVFVRGALSTGQGTPGLGIGLTLVRRLVELHGGTIEAHSEGRGSRFMVRLPRCAGGEAPAALPASPVVRGRRVLLVEDNDDNRDMLATMLGLDGHAVDAAGDGEEGVRRALASRPDVVLIDIGLPDIDGYEVARRIRAQCGQAVRLVALTGFGQPQDRARAVAAGFDTHLVKPVMPDRLAAAIAAPPSAG